MSGRGVNKVILFGNLGADPETRYTANGGAITNIRIATSEQWRDKQTGENHAQPLYLHPPHQPKRTVTYVCPVCAASLERQE